jgi:hypothetical protein
MAKRASGGGVANMSVEDLQRELHKRQRGMSAMMKKRERMVAKLKELDAEIVAMGGKIGPLGPVMGLGGRRRPKNDSNLIEALMKLLDGKTMSVTTIAEEVQKAGYQTTSVNFRTIVNQTLINSGKFKRVGRGQYTLK